MPIPFCRAAFLATAALACTAPLAAQAPRTLDRTTRAELVDRMAGAMERTYVEADTGRMIGDLLRRRLQEGAYDRLDDPARFAETLTRDLRSLNGDLHLGLRYSAGAAQPTPMGPGDPSERNFGMGRVEILDGNVGYLEITGFMGAPGYRDAVVDALRFLSRTRAVIIDVRRNGGGSSEMSHFVFSHFLGATPVPTIRVKRRGGDPVVRESFGDVAGPRRTDVPLYVLTSQGTASAAEEFSFVLKNHGRATIVGSRTAGAGHMVTGVPVGPGFSLGISITRVMDPKTGREWEGTGVIPDLEVPPAEALDAAHAAALTALRGAADGPADVALSRLVDLVAARRRSAPTDRAAAAWAGNYEGRIVSFEDGALWYARRAGALAERLVPLGGSRFGLGSTVYRFEGAGAATTLQVSQADGTTLSLTRGAVR